MVYIVVVLPSSSVCVCVWPVIFFAIREAEKEADKSVLDKRVCDSHPSCDG